MNTALCVLVALVCMTRFEGALTVKTCHTSGNCNVGECCRNSHNQVLTMHDGFGPVMPVDPRDMGFCVAGKAQKGEVCDSSCECDAGLECYRPMSGVCCPPRTCMDKAYVQKQREYWAHCLANPGCALPP